MRTEALISIVLALFLSGCNVSVSTTPPKELPPAAAGTDAQNREAFLAARSIVKAIDRSEYDQVWENSSQMMRSSTNKTVFNGLMSITRKKLGKPAPRGAPRIGFSNQVDLNGPKGQYAIVEVDTNFSGRVITEKVVMVKETEQWKLAGYFMRSSSKL